MSKFTLREEWQLFKEAVIDQIIFWSITISIIYIVGTFMYFALRYAGD